MTDWLATAKADTSISIGSARAIIAPHAGFSYSGPAAAFAYAHIEPAHIKRVFLLGPSHKFYLDGCALSPFDYYKTPVGDAAIDKEVYRALLATGKFSNMSPNEDEDEHSLEMHMPYICHVMKSNPDYTLVPILVGSINQHKENLFGEILAPYLLDPSNLFVVSSDFCHWGSRFNYTFYDAQYGPICKSIEALDKQGMDHIEDIDPQAFGDYLKATQNTICGRHPIGVLLQMLTQQKLRGKFRCRFTRYEQSSSVKSMRESSVSYASAVIEAREYDTITLSE